MATSQTANSNLLSEVHAAPDGFRWRVCVTLASGAMLEFRAGVVELVRDKATGEFRGVNFGDADGYAPLYLDPHEVVAVTRYEPGDGKGTFGYDKGAPE